MVPPAKPGHRKRLPPDVKRVVCPHLGTPVFRAGCWGRPHATHRCWASGTPKPISRGVQARFCLNVAWARCPRLQVQRAFHFRQLVSLFSPTYNDPLLPPVGELAPLIERSPSVSPALWGAALGPLATAVAVFSLLTWQTFHWSTPALSQVNSLPEAGTIAQNANVEENAAETAFPLSEPEKPSVPPVAPDQTGGTGQIALAPATPTPTPAPFVPVRAPEEPAPAPTLEPTPIVTPGPFPPAATTPPTRILIPAIKVDAPVVPVGAYYVREGPYLVRYYQVAEYAAGWHQDSALPGAPGNTVIAGHNNMKGEVFRNLSELEPGDQVYLEADGRWYPYRVVQRLLLREVGVPPEQQFENARWIAPTNDVRLTLVSCWPYETNTHRVIVVAVPDGSQ